MTEETYLPLTRAEIDEQTIRGVADVLRSGSIGAGRIAELFEAALSDFFRGRAVRVFSSGASALEAALRMLGIEEGHEVITTPLAWVANANAILSIGARPVFVDVDPDRRTIDPQQVEAAITSRTRAVLPVHLGGRPCDVDGVYAVAHQHGLRVVEDACHAMGANWRGKPVGSFGDYAVFSFQSSQNLTTIEGGCLVLPGDADASLAERLRTQGITCSGVDGMDVDVVGDSSELTDVEARVGLGQLVRLAHFTARRRTLAQRYFEAFDSLAAGTRGLQLPARDFDDANWHLFQVVLPEHLRRADFMQALKARGVGTGVHFPAVHLFSLYRRLGWKDGDFPHAERIGRSIVSLPLFPTMEEADVDRVVEATDHALRAG